MRSALLIGALLLAGCFDLQAPPASEANTDATAASLTETPAFVAAEPLAAVGDGEVIAEAPEWGVGDAWTWVVESRMPEPLRVTTVVVGVREDGYVLGVTDEAAGVASHWYHLPPHGFVTPGLGWEMHDTVASLLEFPLAEGRTWAATMEGSAITATAELARVDGRDAFRIRGEYDEGGLAFEGIYAPWLENWLSIALHYGSETPWATARVVDRAPATGEVFVQSADDIILAGAGKPGEPTPPQTFEVWEGPQHIVIGCIFGGDAPAVRSIRFVSPAGPIACEQVLDAPAMQVLTLPNAPGTWAMGFALAGPGWAFTEVTAVASVDAAACAEPELAASLKPCHP